VSGLSAVLGKSLSVFEELPAVAIVLILVLVGTTFTTFTSNVATTTILLPIVKELVSITSLWCIGLLSMANAGFPPTSRNRWDSVYQRDVTMDILNILETSYVQSEQQKRLKPSIG